MRLQWYIFGMLARSFAMTLVLVTATVFLVGTLQSFGRYDELSLSLLLGRLPYLVPFALSLAIPLALLIGTLLAYGRLSADNEYLALRMGGIHPIRAFTPAIAFGILLTAISIWVNGTLAPWSNSKAREITRDDLRNFFESLMERRVDEFSSDRVQMRWARADEDGSLVDVDFKLRPDGGERVFGSAARARIARDEELDNIWFFFTDLRITRGNAGVTNDFDELTISYPVASLFEGGGGRDRRNCKTSEELLYRFTRDPLLGRDPRDEKLLGYRTEYSARISLAFACLVFVLVGAPLGLLFRHGSFVGAGFMAILIAFMVYYPLHEVGWHLSFEGTVASEFAMAIPGIVVGALGIALMVRVLRR